VEVEISGSFWKDVEMNQKARLGQGLLNYCYLLAGEKASDFAVAVASELEHVSSGKPAEVLFGRWGPP